MFFSDSWRGPFQRKQVFGNSPHIFFRAHCQVRELSIVNYSWIGLGICPKKVKFVSNWLEAKEKKNIFFIWKKKLSQKREKILFSKVIKRSSNFSKITRLQYKNLFRMVSMTKAVKFPYLEKRQKKNNFLVNSKR